MNSSLLLSKYKTILRQAKTSKFVFKELHLKGFENYCKDVYTFERSDDTSEESFACLVKAVLDAMENETFLPVIRMSDGEFNLIFGRQCPGNWWSYKEKIRHIIRYIAFHFSIKKTFSRTSYSGENTLSFNEAREFTRKAIIDVESLARDGVLAPHLSITHIPFQADYIIPFMRFYNGLDIPDDRYSLTSFYYVYAMLSKGSIFEDQDVQLVTSRKSNDLLDRITSVFINKYGAKSLSFLFISKNNTYLHEIDTSNVIAPSIFLLGAGVAKFHIARQLKQFNRPIIDAGYMIEVWSGLAENNRPFCQI